MATFAPWGDSGGPSATGFATLWPTVVCGVWRNRQGMALGVHTKYSNENILEGACQNKTYVNFGQHRVLSH